MGSKERTEKVLSEIEVETIKEKVDTAISVLKKLIKWAELTNKRLDALESKISVHDKEIDGLFEDTKME